MSVAVLTKVWASSRATKGQLLVLLAIADFADDTGRAWPSVETLATKARLKPRMAQYAIRSLIESGELKILPEKGPFGCHIYQVLSQEGGAILAGVQTLQGAKTARGGAKNDTGGVQPIAPKPSLEPSIEPSVSKGGNGQLHLSEIQERLCDLFNRRHSTPWNPKELRAFKTIGDINPDDLAAIESYYKKERRKGKDGRHRRDLCTFLNNFQGEVDRANANEPTHWKGSQNFNSIYNDDNDEDSQ